MPNDRTKLRPGMFARVFIEFGRRRQAILLPRTALVRREGRDGIFLVDEQKSTARFVPVTVDITTPELVAIGGNELTGKVVTLGHHLLSDGAAVILPGQNHTVPDQQTDAAPRKQP